jgi:hypothetical protein
LRRRLEYVATATVDVAVTDALFPYLPSLRAWGHLPEQIIGFLVELARIVRPVVLYVDGDPLSALPRAAAREQDTGWLDWYVGKLAAVAGSGVHSLPTAAAYLRVERDLTLQLLEDWDLHVLPAGPPEELLSTAQAVITSALASLPRHVEG